MKRFFFFVLILFLLFNVTLGGFAAYGWHLFNSPGPLKVNAVLILEKGSGLRLIARNLKSAGIIHDELAFMFGVRVEEQSANLKAGEFQFTAGMSSLDVMNLLVSGKIIAHYLTIPEGLQSREIIALLQSTAALSGALTEPLPEGSALPETYHYSRNDTRNAVALRMKKAMKQTLKALWGEGQTGTLIKTKQEMLVLASIIEKETGIASERAHVAGVFLNRLRKKMRLQSDPTVVYGITMGQSDLGRPISKKDLAAVNDYNTYSRTGLPIGPICNPGLESLKAVLSPLTTKDLYFVADGKGGHQFAETLKQHNRNVRNWRKLKKK